MQTTPIVISKVEGNIRKGNRTKRYFPGNKTLQKGSCKIETSGYGFLRNKIKRQKSIFCLPEFCEENYCYLYESVENYLSLLGSSMPEPDGSFITLYKILKDKLYKDQELHLIRGCNGELFFRIGYPHDFLVNEVCFIPCKILAETSGKFREILLLFFRMFSLQGITSMYEEFDFEMLMDSMGCEYDPKNDPEECKLLFNYEKGDIRGIFNEISAEPCNLHTLSEAISSYVPNNNFEGELLELIKKGIEIFGMNECIVRYVYEGIGDLSEEELDYGDYYVIPFDREVRVVYDADDLLTENLLEGINADYGQYGYSDYIPATFIDISPETKEVLTYGYPELFFEWIFDLISKLRNDE